MRASHLAPHLSCDEQANLGFSGFGESQSTKRKDPSILLLAASLFVSAAAAVTNTFAAGLNPIVFGSLLFACCIAAGGAGALIGENLLSGREMPRRSSTHSWTYGASAGLIAGLVSALPHLSVTTTASRLRSSVDDLTLLTMLCLLFSLAAGLSFERVLRIVARGATDVIDSRLKETLPNTGPSAEK